MYDLIPLVEAFICFRIIHVCHLYRVKNPPPRISDLLEYQGYVIERKIQITHHRFLFKSSEPFPLYLSKCVNTYKDSQMPLRYTNTNSKHKEFYCLRPWSGIFSYKLFFLIYGKKFTWYYYGIVMHEPIFFCVSETPFTNFLILDYITSISYRTMYLHQS